jgi:nitrate reductase NapE component
MDTPMPLAAHTEGDQCETCAKLAAEQAASQETSFAFLLALVPVLSLTFFGQVGLL